MAGSGIGLVIQVGANTAAAIAELRGVETALNDQMSTAEKWGGRMNTAAAFATAGLVAMGAVMGKLVAGAVEDAAAQQTLATSLRNTAGATDEAIASAEDWISAQGRVLGVADDELRPALASLATATGDVTEAQKLATLAMDVAAARGVPVAQAADAIAKAYAGNTTALGRLVPGLDQAAVKSGDFATVSAELARVVGGQAAAAAGTAAGQYQIMQVAIAETGESIGAALLPMVEQLAPVLVTTAQWVGENSDLLVRLAAVVAAAAAAIIAFNTVMKVARVVMAAFKAAQLVYITMGYLMGTAGWAALGPLILIPIAIAVVIAIVILVVKYWDQLVAAFKTGAAWMKSVFVTVWDAVAAAISKVVGWLKSAYDWVKKIIDSGIGKITGMFGGGASTRTATFATVPATGRVAPMAAAPVNITVNTGIGDPAEIARQIRRILAADRVRVGWTTA